MVPRARSQSNHLSPPLLKRVNQRKSRSVKLAKARKLYVSFLNEYIQVLRVSITSLVMQAVKPVVSPTHWRPRNATLVGKIIISFNLERSRLHPFVLLPFAPEHVVLALHLAPANPRLLLQSMPWHPRARKRRSLFKAERLA